VLGLKRWCAIDGNLRGIHHVYVVRKTEDVERRLSLNRQDSGRESRISVEVLVDDRAWHDREVACLPLVSLSVVNVVPMALQYVQRGIVLVPMLLRPSSRRENFLMDMQTLNGAVIRI
jgi:hypothetical protein